MVTDKVTPKSKDVSGWYNDIVLRSGLADYGPAKGTMVFRSYGFAIWEKVQEVFNGVLKTKGVENAYFPMFIPYSLLETEKEHVEGFSPELAIVTIGGGEELKEKLVVRPTSETIMYSMWSKWYQSWRDFPILMNQWANVVRWEKRTYLFLRTSEFLWQEGHTAHVEHEEAKEMTLWALEQYRKLYAEHYAMYGIVGKKSKKERFAGADETYTIEFLMPDGKALQGATSHDLGQNFAKAFNFTFQSRDKDSAYPWQTSWGLSTRSLGGMILAHGDDTGLILPPKLAPVQVVIVPIIFDESESEVISYAKKIEEELVAAGLRVKLDTRDYSSGFKHNEWEMKGVPVRIEIGPKEAEQNKVLLKFRIKEGKELVDSNELTKQIENHLKTDQEQLFEKSKKFVEGNTSVVEDYEQFKEVMTNKRGFIRAFWCEDEECESKIKAETKATTRCLPLDAKKEEGKCVYCGKKADYRWYFAQAY